MATEWKFYYMCPGGHKFPMDVDQVFTLPSECPTCRMIANQTGLYKRWKTLRKFRKELKGFRIE